MADDALEVVKLRNNFYRDNYRRVVFILLLSIVVNAILLGCLWWVITNPRPPEYFATTADGRIIPLKPLSEPNISEAALLEFAVQAATSPYTYNFVNYRKRLQEASAYFTPQGWAEFLKILQASNNLKAVIAKKLVVTAVPTGAPVVVQKGIIRGRYAWKVQLPLLITYQSASTQIQQSVLVTMLITRVPTLNQPKGIGVAQFVAQGS